MPTSQDFKLKSLYLNRCASYGPTPDEFEGSIEFDSGMGAIKLRVDGALSKAILRLVADLMVVSTQKLAAGMTASVFNQDLAPQLSGPDLNALNADPTN